MKNTNGVKNNKVVNKIKVLEVTMVVEVPISDVKYCPSTGEYYPSTRSITR